MAFYTCKQFSPVLNSPKHHCVLRVIFWDIGIRPVLISPDDNKGKRGENKTGANVSLYTSVCHFNHKTFVSGILLSHTLEHHFPQLNRYWCHSFKNIMLEKTAKYLLSQNSPRIIWWYCDIWIHCGLFTRYPTNILWIFFSSCHEITRWTGVIGCGSYLFVSFSIRTKVEKNNKKWNNRYLKELGYFVILNARI